MAEMLASLLVAPLQKFLDWLQRERHHHDAQIQAAICAISEALSASRRYLEEFEGRRGGDRNREFEIANLWAVASARALSVCRQAER